MPRLVAMAEPLLRIEGVSVRFGGIVALDGVSFDVERGQICGLIGPNGAGKTTLFNCLSRIYDCDGGRIEFDGHAILDVPRHRMAALGIGRTFQNLALFSSMTVLENVMVGGHCRTRTGYIENLLRLSTVEREERQVARHAGELMRFLDLDAVAGRPVRDLPFGVQKRVELARALASNPKLLLLDEPAGGLNHAETETLRELIRDIRDRFKLTVLLVEHHLNLVMLVSDKVVALDFGRKIAEGRPSEIQTNTDVIRAYLGTAQ